MFRKFFTFFAVVISSCLTYTNVSGQYYYRDVWNPGLLTKEMIALKQQKVGLVSTRSFESSGEPSEGFFCEKKISKNFTLVETFTRSNFTSQSLLSSYFNAKGLIIRTADSSETSLNITEYIYNDKDEISEIKTLARANDERGAIAETHQYLYSTNGQLKKMVKNKNDKEISIVNFKLDEQGNIIEEEEVIKNGKGTKYFYYYDDRKNLTDVVHYFERAKRLLPDYMYEYTPAGEIKQMITTDEGGGYFTWRYTYNDQNLRTTEVCFSKDKKLVGRVEYSYVNSK